MLNVNVNSSLGPPLSMSAPVSFERPLKVVQNGVGLVMDKGVPKKLQHLIVQFLIEISDTPRSRRERWGRPSLMYAYSSFTKSDPSESVG